VIAMASVSAMTGMLSVSRTTLARAASLAMADVVGDV